MSNPLYFSNFIDCESTQPAINDPALGERASYGFAKVLESHNFKGTFYCIASEAAANAKVYHQLQQRGHEIGLHVHGADIGYEEFLGIYGPDDQRKILIESTDRFEQAMGFRPNSVCLGYGSSNDYTRALLVELGYRHGMTQIPGRILPECASVAAGAPLDPYYPNPYNRVLRGDLDFVEIPLTVDPDSMMWGGKHPQDLRVELVDAKNHYYTIAKTIKRQFTEKTPLKIVVSMTHNIFEYSDPKDFRYQTLQGMIGHTLRIAQEHGLQVIGVTQAQLAKIYRTAVPISSDSVALKLDRRGYIQTTNTH